MCASCGCGCKMGMPAKGCKCTCKTCRDARTMSVEKSMLVRKAMRNFDAIYDAYLVDDDDLVVDEKGNVYALVKKAGIINDKDSKQGLAETAATLTGGYLVGSGYRGKGGDVFPPEMTGRGKEALARHADHMKINRINRRIQNAKLAAGGTLMVGGLAHGIKRATKDKKENKM